MAYSMIQTLRAPSLGCAANLQLLKRKTCVNHKNKETACINSVQSSLNSHPLWVDIYEKNH